MKSVALHENTTKIKDVCESVSFSLNKVFKCSHTGVRYAAISFAFFSVKKAKVKAKPKESGKFNIQVIGVRKKCIQHKGFIPLIFILSHILIRIDKDPLVTHTAGAQRQEEL